MSRMVRKQLVKLSQARFSERQYQLLQPFFIVEADLE